MKTFSDGDVANNDSVKYFAKNITSATGVNPHHFNHMQLTAVN